MDDVAALAVPETPPDVGVEVPLAQWSPREPQPSVSPAGDLLFTDGVRRIDARVWIDDDDAGTRLGVCASYAAGIVRCWGDGTRRAEVIGTEVARGLFTGARAAAPIVTRHATFGVRAAAGEALEQLTLAVQQRMGELEVVLAGEAGDADLIVIDGPLRGRARLDNAIGYVKTHHVAYLPGPAAAVVGALQPGQRTPLFLTTTSWSRYSWYVRLPSGLGARRGGGVEAPLHAWAGIVRCEASADLDPPAAARLADVAALTLPRFASRGHKDPRAPQNLYPISGLERILRHRLGDPLLLYRALCQAAAGAPAA
jgi:hypothetical protein